MEKRIKLIAINETEIIGQNNFQKRTIETETIEQFPNKFLFEFHHDNVTIPDAFKPGDELTVSFDIKGTKYQKEGTPKPKPMFFVSLIAWNLKRS